MMLAHFQVGQSEDRWVVRFEDREYAQPSREAAIAVATDLATKIARLDVETVVFIEPVTGDSWTEWRPRETQIRPAHRPAAGPVRRSDEVPYLRLISGG